MDIFSSQRTDLKNSDELILLNSQLNEDPAIIAMLRYSPGFAGILNSKRQFVIANEELLSRYTDLSGMELIGKLPHDVFACATELSGGSMCGEIMKCGSCELNMSISKVLSCGKPFEGHVRLLSDSSGLIENREFLLYAYPYNFKHEQMVLLSIQDITDYEVKNFMMRLFFHDILNSFTNMDSLLHLLKIDMENEHANTEYMEMMHASFEDAVEQIHFFQTLSLMDINSVSAYKDKISVHSEIERLVSNISIYLEHNELDITLNTSLSPLSIVSDKMLVRRIILNMLKNAVEASENGDKITVSLTAGEDNIAVSVSNPAVIPENYRESIFQRGFSTKGKGRGLGTYSMKLLSTRFLSGDISFATDDENGTVFTLTLPYKL